MMAAPWMPPRDCVEEATRPYYDRRGYPWLAVPPVTERLHQVLEYLDSLTDVPALYRDDVFILHATLTDIARDVEALEALERPLAKERQSGGAIGGKGGKEASGKFTEASREPQTRDKVGALRRLPGLGLLR
jgi:hypothetical protein